MQKPDLSRNYMNFLVSRFMQGQIKKKTHQREIVVHPYPTWDTNEERGCSERINIAALEKRNIWQGKDWFALFPALTSTVVLIPPESAARAVCFLTF